MIVATDVASPTLSDGSRGGCNDDSKHAGDGSGDSPDDSRHLIPNGVQQVVPLEGGDETSGHCGFSHLLHTHCHKMQVTRLQGSLYR